MRLHLIVKLRRPVLHQSYRVDVDPESFSIATEGFDSSETTQLNQQLAGIRQQYPDAELFASFPKFIKRLREQHGSDRPLALFFRIAFPTGTPEDALSSLGDELRAASPLIDTFAIGGGFQAACDTTQMYVESSQFAGGLNIAPAWDLPGGDGGSVKICVLDFGYQSQDYQLGDHVDLPHDRIDYVNPMPVSISPGHGTLVMGILAGNLAAAPVGIAHGARFFIASTMPRTQGDLQFFDPQLGENSVEEARLVIHAMDDALAGTYLTNGDVFLVERETDKHDPMEIDPDVATAMREAAALGITVVEPAGNGGKNLNGMVAAMETAEDSLAIMVGAGHAPGTLAPLTRFLSSNFGDRVNCQAWGECIYTTKMNTALTDPPDDPAWYANDFGETSGASAIIAGLVAVLQSIHFAARGFFMKPADIRKLLKDKSLGLEQPDAEHIGPQPDLIAILRYCGLLPDVFIRDDKDDAGEEPSASEEIWHSPDIITRKTAVADAAAELGNWDDINLGEDLIIGAPGVIYLRLDNRGPFDDQPKVTVYWTYPGTFLDPVNWHLIGEVTLNIPGTLGGGATRVIAGPITWNTPGDTTSPCLIAVSNSTLDGAPALSNLSTVADYAVFIGKYNNLAHRNVQLVEAATRMAFFRFNVNLPRLPQAGSHRIRVIPRHAPRQAKLFIGLPPDEEEQAFLRGTSRLRPRDLRALLAESQHTFGVSGKVAEELLRSPAGDRRRLERRPERWLVSEAEEVLFPDLGLRPGKQVPLMIGVHMPPKADLSRFEIAVVQEFGERRIGQIHLRMKHRPGR